MNTTKQDMECLRNAITAVGAIQQAIGLAFQAYDEMTPTERCMFKASCGRFDLSSVLERIMDKVALHNAESEAPVEKEVIVDQDTGLSYTTVEGGADHSVKEYCRNEIALNDSNE